MPNENKPNDPVNHPSHYNSHPSGVECIEITRHMSFNVGNVFKYLWRAGLKGADNASTSFEAKKAAALQDHKKAFFYLKDEIARLEKELNPGIVVGMNLSTPSEDHDATNDGKVTRTKEELMSEFLDMLMLDERSVSLTYRKSFLSCLKRRMKRVQQPYYLAIGYEARIRSIIADELEGEQSGAFLANRILNSIVFA